MGGDFTVKGIALEVSWNFFEHFRMWLLYSKLTLLMESLLIWGGSRIWCFFFFIPSKCLMTDTKTWTHLRLESQIFNQIYFKKNMLYIYTYIGSISLLIQISLNIIDIFCLHIFLLILSYCRMDSIWRELIDIFSIIVYFPKLQILEALHIRNMQPNQTQQNIFSNQC